LSTTLLKELMICTPILTFSNSQPKAFKIFVKTACLQSKAHFAF
jgi:hypothetical protein